MSNDNNKQSAVSDFHKKYGPAMLATQGLFVAGPLGAVLGAAAGYVAIAVLSDYEESNK